MKFREIFQFEFRYQLRKPSTWIYFLALSGVLYLVLDEIVEYARTVEEIFLFSGYTIADLASYTNKFGLLMIAALASEAGIRDIQTRVYPLVYTSSIAKTPYIAGRLLAVFGIGVALQTLSLVLLTAGASFLVHDIDLGIFQVHVYFDAVLYLVIPNVFIQTVLLFSLVLLFRWAMAAYFGVAVLLLLGIVSQEFISSGWYQIGQLVDPSAASNIAMQSWSLTLAERNTLSIAFTGMLLANRMLWLVISLLVAILSINRFRFKHDTTQKRRFEKFFIRKNKPCIGEPSRPSVKHVAGPSNIRWNLHLIWELSSYSFKVLLRSGFGIAVVLAALGALISIPHVLKGPLDVPILLTTKNVLNVMSHPIMKGSVVLLLGLATGQLVWHQRDNRTNEITDTTRVSSAQFITGNFSAISLLILVILVALTSAGIGAQRLSGYYHHHLVLYGYSMLDQLTTYMLFAAMSLFLHVLANHKYVGNMLVALFCLYALQPSMFGIEHKLLVFASSTGLASSDFFSEKFFLAPLLLFKLIGLASACS